MDKVDELRLNCPFAGRRMLHQRGVDAGQLNIGTFMKKMGIGAICRNTATKT